MCFTVCTHNFFQNVRMSDLEATLTTLNNSINNTITDYTPVFGGVEEKSQLLDGVEIQVSSLLLILSNNTVLYTVLYSAVCHLPLIFQPGAKISSVPISSVPLHKAICYVLLNYTVT